MGWRQWFYVKTRTDSFMSTEYDEMAEHLWVNTLVIIKQFKNTSPVPLYMR